MRYLFGIYIMQPSYQIFLELKEYSLEALVGIFQRIPTLVNTI